MKQVSTGAGLCVLGACVLGAAAINATGTSSTAVAAIASGAAERPRVVSAWSAESLSDSYILTADGGVWFYKEELVEDPDGRTLPELTNGVLPEDGKRYRRVFWHRTYGIDG